MKEKAAFFLTTPLIWLISSVCSYYYPGDEYFLYYVGSMPGTLIADKIGFSLNIFFPFIAALVSLPFISLLTFILYKIRLNWKWILSIWLIVMAVLFFSTILRYPSYAKAISKNGSLQAYIFFSINFSLYWVLPLAILIKVIILFIHKMKNNKRN